MRTSSFRYLERKVLEKVCCAIRLVCLRSAARVDPHSHRRCLCPWRILSSNLKGCQQDVVISFVVIQPTVRPLESVVLSVAVFESTGVAKPLTVGCIDFRAVRLRRARLRLSARRREAMSPKGWEGGGG
jgi:hypothetical protein